MPVNFSIKSFDRLFYPGLFSLFILLSSCSSQPEEESLFTLLSPTETNINFENRVKDTVNFNMLNYLYFYDGGGVAVGDINNNNLPDIFFVGNEVENKLYLNKRNFTFEDITESAGVAGDPGAWSKGATMADVNGNGYLDIYVTRVNYLNKEGANQLFINNGDGSFTEQAEEFGLDFRGYSTQAAFFDYNQNGRLDMFLLNHSMHSEETLNRGIAQREVDDPNAGDRLFRNDGDRFTEVTSEAGIYSSPLGYGLGVAIRDITQNGWPDIYVGNDFLEDDYLYINQGDGTFIESLYSSFGHTSHSSMGNDIADITNNGLPDVISLDMMPEDHETFMRSGGPDRQNDYDRKRDSLGFGHKNERNTLQINRGKNPEGVPVFSETAFLSGVARTDWSWASLFMDLNNNGWKDLLVTNGMVGRPNDMDYLSWIRRADPEPWEAREYLNDALEQMPELKIPNYVYRNNADLTFTNMTGPWGLDQQAISSGAAHADLNNNGRLDLIVSNVNMPSFIYKNNTSPDDTTANYLKVQLFGDGQNTTGIGSKVILYEGDNIYYQEQRPTRGYQSSVDHVMHFGVGENVELDSLKVIWPDGRYESLRNVRANQLLELRQNNASGTFDYNRLGREYGDENLTDVTDETAIDFQHREDAFNDYSREPLMPYKLSTQGPALAVGDISGNSLDDVFIGGGSGQTAGLYMQQNDGAFSKVDQDVFEEDRWKDDVDASFFDATGNVLLDLYVVSGGGRFSGDDPELKDRLYINEGNGQFHKSDNRLPELFVNGSVVRPMDYNSNGHVDLFVGGRSIPHQYGLSPRSVILKNDGSGYFRDVTEDIAPDLEDAGMVTDARWLSMSDDQHPDLVVAAEWMPIQYYRNDDGRLTDQTSQVGLNDTNGLWQSLLIDDITGDGHADIVAGNFGLNSRIQATSESPFRLYVNDFEGDGANSPLIASYIDGDYYPFEQLDILVQQFSNLTRRVNSYEDFSTQTVRSLFGEDEIATSQVREITDLKTSFFVNNGEGSFTRKELPVKAQFSPVMGIHALENHDAGGKDLMFGGNIYDVRPSIGGRQDADYGLYLQRTEEGQFQSLEIQSSGLYIEGEVRDMREVMTPEGRIILVARNNDGLNIFKRF